MTGKGEIDMGKKQLTAEEKRLDVDLWIIALVTFGVFFYYAAAQDQLMRFIKDSNISVASRLLVNAGLQFGIAGLGVTIVCVLRKEKFTQFGLTGKNLPGAIFGTVLCFVPLICCTVASGQFRGYRPFSILLTEAVVASGFPLAPLGMALIAAVWGFFEGFNYVVISEKINRRYPSGSFWMDYGAIACGIICVLFHPIHFSFWGIIDIFTCFAAIYGMLLVKKRTGNAWGCVFAFCFIWNAI